MRALCIRFVQGRYSIILAFFLPVNRRDVFSAIVSLFAEAPGWPTHSSFQRSHNFLTFPLTRVLLLWAASALYRRLPSCSLSNLLFRINIDQTQREQFCFISSFLISQTSSGSGSCVSGEDEVIILCFHSFFSQSSISVVTDSRHQFPSIQYYSSSWESFSTLWWLHPRRMLEVWFDLSPHACCPSKIHTLHRQTCCQNIK